MGRGTKIYISYRRDRAESDARRLYQILERGYGADSLLFDDGRAPRPGREADQALDRRIAETGVMLVLIGEKWLDRVGPDGARRIDDPASAQRREIAAGLKSGAAVIPVLLDKAMKPGAAALPQEVAGLARRSAIRLRQDRLQSDVADLGRAIQGALGASTGRARGVARSGAPDRHKPGVLRWFFATLLTAAALYGGFFLAMR